MIIIGHSIVPSFLFYHIQEFEEITKTPPNSVIYIEKLANNYDIIEYLNQNNIPYGIGAKEIKDVVIAAALNASYIIVSQDFAKTAQDIAEKYLFDSKIIAHIYNEDEMEKMAIEGIDGVIFPSGIVKIV